MLGEIPSLFPSIPFEIVAHVTPQSVRDAIPGGGSDFRE
jgi:hypothetical protein